MIKWQSTITLSFKTKKTKKNKQKKLILDNEMFRMTILKAI